MGKFDYLPFPKGSRVRHRTRVNVHGEKLLGEVTMANTRSTSVLLETGEKLKLFTRDATKFLIPNDSPK